MNPASKLKKKKMNFGVRVKQVIDSLPDLSTHFVIVNKLIDHIGHYLSSSALDFLLQPDILLIEP